MKLKIFSIIFLLILGIGAWYISTGYFSSGERAGTISKLSERGYVFKTNEGVLNEGGYAEGVGSMTPRYWEFSAKNDTVVEKLKMALSTGERITLHYQEKFLQFPWNGDTKYFITDVTFLKNHNAGVQSLLPAQSATVKIDTSKVDTLRL